MWRRRCCVWAWLVTPVKTSRGQGPWLQHQYQRQCGELRGFEGDCSNGEIAQVNESFTLSKGEAPMLEINAVDRGNIRVRGWDHADYSVETCKVAVAETRRGGRPDGARDFRGALGGANLLQRPGHGFHRVDGGLHCACAARCVVESGSEERADRRPRRQRQRQTARRQRADRDRRLRRQRGSAYHQWTDRVFRAIAAKCT